MFTISETLLTNSIIWIRSLSEDEKGPSERILEDLEPYCEANDIHFECHDVANAQELADTLQRIERLARENNLRPIIHFDSHGSESDGLWLKPDGEDYPWDKLADDLRAINIATQNNLTCIFATCYAYHICKSVELKKATPAYLIMAPHDVIYESALMTHTVAFYQRVVTGGNLTDAFMQTFAKSMMLYHCQGVFLESLAKYVADHCSSNDRQERTEKLLTWSVQQGRSVSLNRAQLRLRRRQIKSALKPGQKIIDHYAPGFLIGREAQFDFSQVAALAKLPSMRRRAKTSLNAKGKIQIG